MYRGSQKSSFLPELWGYNSRVLWEVHCGVWRRAWRSSWASSLSSSWPRGSEGVRMGRTGYVGGVLDFFESFPFFQIGRRL